MESKVTFYTQYVRPERRGEVIAQESKTETAGYLPAEVQIRDMIAAGKRLADFRQGYDFGPGQEVDDDFIDPTRDPNFDMADASQLERAVKDRLVRQKKAAEKPPEVDPEDVEKSEDIGSDD